MRNPLVAFPLLVNTTPIVDDVLELLENPEKVIGTVFQNLSIETFVFLMIF